MDFDHPHRPSKKGDAAGGMARKGATSFWGREKLEQKRQLFWEFPCKLVGCFFCMSQNGELGFFQLDDLKLDNFKM